MTTRTVPRRSPPTPSQGTAHPGRDRLLDEALERLQHVVTTLVAVRTEHSPVTAHTRWLHRRTRICADCRQPFPCATRRLLHRSQSLPAVTRLARL